MFTDDGLQCCCIIELSHFATDDDDDYDGSEWARNYREERIREDKDDMDSEVRLNKNTLMLAAVNSHQLKAKALLEKHGFVVIQQLVSNEDKKPVYLMARNWKDIKSPREKRGSLLRRLRGKKK